MKKNLLTKGLVTCVAAGVMAVCLMVGCAQAPASSQDSADKQGDAVEQPAGEGLGGQAEESDGSFDMSLYPEHVSNCSGADSLGGFHLALGQDCTSCHNDSLENQLGAVEIDGEPALSSMYYTDNDTCLSSGCHDSWESLAEKTAELGDYNPHDNVHGQLNCNACHKAHSAQVNTCDQCHYNGGEQEMLF